MAKKSVDAVAAEGDRPGALIGAEGTHAELALRRRRRLPRRALRHALLQHSSVMAVIVAVPAEDLRGHPRYDNIDPGPPPGRTRIRRRRSGPDDQLVPALEEQ